jgi:ubiquitin-conjugating enzyme E2 Q
MIHPQDPAYTPRNGATRLVIPSTPSSRQRITLADSADVEMIDAPPISTPSRKKKKNKIQGAAIAGMFYGTGNSADDPYILDPEDQGSWDDASITTDTEDLLALLSDDEEERHEPEVDKGKGKEVVPAKPARIDEFQPGTLDTSQIQFLKPPSYASSMATKRLSSDLQSIIKLQESTPLEQLGFYINPDHVDNVYQWIVELHSFPETLPLVQDMCSKNPILRSIVLEIRFGPQYPMTPPFVRVVKPRFLGFNQGGGGNVTLGGAMCMELLTNSGWSAVSTVESVLMQVRLAMMDEERPARLERGAVGSYSVAESVEAFKRACRNHGWKEPEGMESFIRQ